MTLQQQLINSIVSNLGIKEDTFSIGMIEDSLEGVEPQQYKEFFNMLMGDTHEYLKPLDRVAKVAERFKASKKDELFKDTHTMAKTFYDKISTINADMTTYSQANRDAVPNDREFFENFNYAKDIKGFTEQDIYVLKELGGGTWVMNIKFISNSSEAIKKIEKIIKTAITAKYLQPKHDAIASNIKGLLK